MRAVKQKVWSEAKTKSKARERRYGRVRFVLFVRVRRFLQSIDVIEKVALSPQLFKTLSVVPAGT